MRYSVKTADNKFWIGSNGEFITPYKAERAVYDTKDLAQWYIDNTNIFGDLTIKKITLDSCIKLYDEDPECEHELDPSSHSGMKCLKCSGWYCY